MDISRREFVVGCSAAIAAMTGGWVSNLAFAAPGDTTRRDILVVVFLRGGCDGLSLVAPVNDADYVVARGDLRLRDGGTDAALPLGNPLPGGDFRLHPRAAPLKELYDAGRLAVVHACGLTSGTRSHFEAMDYMERGQPDGTGAGTGWLARHLLTTNPQGLLPALAASGNTPDSLLGTSSAVALTDANNFRLTGASNTYATQMQSALQSFYTGSTPLLRAGAATLSAIKAVNDSIPRGSNGNPLPYTPEAGAEYPTGAGSGLGNALRTVARLVKMDVGLEMATVDFGGWDTHENQGNIFPNLIDGLSRALHAFFNDLLRYQDRLTVVVMSEFGRRLKANRSAGTDHGHGNLMLVLGGGIRGGKMYGRWPGLATEQLDNGVDLAITTDYRAVLAELLDARMANPATAEVFPGLGSYQPLGLAYAPGQEPPPGIVGAGRATYLPLVRR
jgi:uncharacterized protein (DUF1501 family)